MCHRRNSCPCWVERVLSDVYLSQRRGDSDQTGPKCPLTCVGHVCGPHDASDLLHRLQVWRETCGPHTVSTTDLNIQAHLQKKGKVPRLVQRVTILLPNLPSSPAVPTVALLFSPVWLSPSFYSCCFNALSAKSNFAGFHGNTHRNTITHFQKVCDWLSSLATGSTFVF